jgi:hypothetical protein
MRFPQLPGWCQEGSRNPPLPVGKDALKSLRRKAFPYCHGGGDRWQGWQSPSPRRADS